MALTTADCLFLYADDFHSATISNLQVPYFSDMHNSCSFCILDIFFIFVLLFELTKKC